MQTSVGMWGRVVAVAAVFAALVACSPASSSKSSTSVSAASAKDCAKTCDPKGNGNAYLDAAYSNTYEPCFNEAVRQGTTAQALGCTAKATQTCIALCEGGR